MGGTPDIISKTEFAALTRVTPPRVTQWISAGKLTGDALVGEGRSARIRVQPALEQLKKRLNIDQRLSGNGIETRLNLPAADAATSLFETQPQPPRDPQPQSAADRIEDQIKAGRLESLRRQNRKLAEDEAVRAGRYVLADGVAQQMGRALSQHMAWMDGIMSELATAVAAQFSLPNRDIVHCLRTAFREARERGSADFQTVAEALPSMIEDNIADDTDDALLAD
jgi:thioredoxin-like negative regulator of GroEL